MLKNELIKNNLCSEMMIAKTKVNKKSEKLQDVGIKGITLVALVVTIVILLILAGITITMLFGENGIIKKAQDAGEATKNSQDKEMQGLSNLEEIISEATGEYAWKVSADGTKVVNKNYPEGIEIGSYINYDCMPVDGSAGTYTSYSVENASPDKNEGRSSGYNSDQTFSAEAYKNTGYSWRVLGADDKGQLMLISEETVPITIASGEDNTLDYYWGEGGTRNCYLIQGKVGYKNGIAELNAISDIYGHGEGATGGRLLTIEEINKMTGLNGNNIDGSGTLYGKGQIDEYGKEVKYYWDGTDKPYYEYTTAAGEKKTGKLRDGHANFTWYNEETKKFETMAMPTDLTTQVTDVASMRPITTIKSTYYAYFVPGTSMETNKVGAYKTLFINSSTGLYTDYVDDVIGVIYYIGSSAVSTGSYYASWGVGAVYDDGVYGDIGNEVNSDGGENYFCCGVRPAVSLKSNIKLTKRSDQRDGCNFYDIVEK